MDYLLPIFAGFISELEKISGVSGPPVVPKTSAPTPAPKVSVAPTKIAKPPSLGIPALRSPVPRGGAAAPSVGAGMPSAAQPIGRVVPKARTIVPPMARTAPML